MAINLNDDIDEMQQDGEIMDDSTDTKSTRKAKSEAKKAREREVRGKLSRLMEKKRLRNEFDNIDGWL